MPPRALHACTLRDEIDTLQNPTVDILPTSFAWVALEHILRRHALRLLAVSIESISMTVYVPNLI